MLLLVACQTSPDDGGDQGVRVVPDSGGYLYDGITWAGDGGLIVSRTSIGPPTDEARLSRLNLTTGAIEDHRDPPPDASCARIDEGAPHWDPIDDQLLWIRACLTKRRPVSSRFDVLAAQSLEDEPSTVWSAQSRLPIRRLDVHDGTMVTSFGTGICETLAQLVDSTVEPLEIEVSGPGGTFSTAYDPSTDECLAAGIALIPASNADGALAFFASTEAMSRSGVARLSAPFDVYIRPASGGDPVRLDMALRSPTSIIWSIDSRVLLVGGRDRDGAGTWRLDPETGDRTRVLPFALGSPAWSIDGSQVIATRAVAGEDVGIEEVVVIDAERLLGELP